MTVRLTLVSTGLPEGFDALKADAEFDGHRHISRLAREFENTPEMFHAIFTAFADDRLLGIGAITCEPCPMSEPALRMRRFSVSREFRRRGVARMLASALLLETAGKVRFVTVHAGNEQAAMFWQKIGFRPDPGNQWTHIFDNAAACVQQRVQQPSHIPLTDI